MFYLIMKKLFSLFISLVLFLVFTFSFVNAEQSSLIPAWIKNNAGWWSDGLISDNDFVAGLQYMFDNNILQISEHNDEIPSVIIITDKLEYSHGENVEIIIKNIGTETVYFITGNYGMLILSGTDKNTVCCVASEERVELNLTNK